MHAEGGHRVLTSVEQHISNGSKSALRMHQQPPTSTCTHTNSGTERWAKDVATDLLLLALT